MMSSMQVSAAIPEFATWINPVLRALNELGGSARPREVVERVALNEGVSDEVLDQLNPAGGQRFPNQVHWARFFLADAGLIEKRGQVHLPARDLDGAPIRVDSIRHLIMLKRAAGRPLDLDDIQALREIAAATGQAAQ